MATTPSDRSSLLRTETGRGYDTLAIRDAVPRRIDLLRIAMDWSEIDAVVDEVDIDCRRRIGITARGLVRALAIGILFDIDGDDLEFQLADRSSFRAMVSDGSRTPKRADIAAFVALLDAADLSTRVHGLIDHGRARMEALAGGGAESMRVVPPNPADGTPAPDFLDADWVELEARFVALWETKRGRRDAPSLDDFASGLPVGLIPFFGIVAVADAPRWFVYERVGEQVGLRNGRSLVGQSIGEKAQDNIQRFGSPGLQGYLLQSCHRAIEAMRPVAMTCFFRNYHMQASRIWQVTAPLRPRDGAPPNRLVFCALIKPVLLA